MSVTTDLMETEKYNILYVDDEPSNLNSFKLLYRRKFNILTANSGQEGLDILAANPIHLIFTDQRMPGMTGVEFLKKAKEKWPDPKCILLTGFTDNEAIKEAVNVIGIYWYVNKPYDTEQMELLINKAIEAYQIEKDKKIMEEQLLASEEKFRGIYDSIVDVFVRTDMQGICQLISPSVYDLFGFKPEEIIGLPMAQFYSKPADREKFKEEILVNGKLQNYKIEGKKKDGSLNMLSINSRIYNDEDGNPIGIESLVRDITEQIIIEDLLKENEEKFKGVFDSIVDVFTRTNNDGILEMVSPSVYDLIGYKAEEVIGKKTSSFFVNPDSRNLIPQALEKSEGAKIFESEIIKKNGSKIFISSHSKIYFDNDGNPQGVESITRDITDKKEAENKIIKLNQTLEIRVLERTAALEIAKKNLENKAIELRQASNYKSQFLANMSHELRTPLNSILLLSKLMSDNTDGNLNKEQIEFATVIHDSGNGLLELINDILDLSKIESGKMEMEIEEIELSSILKTLDGLFRPLAKEKGITFKCGIDKKIPSHIIVDRMRLEQVLKNLLSNAIKFTSDGGVEMRIFMPGKRERFKNPMLKNRSVIGFEVKDSGIGIPKDKLKLIFEPFEQADGSTRRKFGGTGLGLSISRKIATMLGGKLALDSIEGKGSTFTLYLPSDASTAKVDDNKVNL